jgi:hypothetical protein
VRKHFLTLLYSCQHGAAHYIFGIGYFKCWRIEKQALSLPKTSSGRERVPESHGLAWG